MSTTVPPPDSTHLDAAVRQSEIELGFVSGWEIP